MKKRLPGHRMMFLIGVLMLTIMLGAANAVHAAWLKHELQAIAEAEYTRLQEQGALSPGQDSVIEVSIAKRWVVFGPAFGKMTVYTRLGGGNGGAQYGVLELHYERRDSGWVQVESGYCTGSECVPAAARAFAADE